MLCVCWADLLLGTSLCNHFQTHSRENRFIQFRARLATLETAKLRRAFELLILSFSRKINKKILERNLNFSLSTILPLKLKSFKIRFLPFFQALIKNSLSSTLIRISVSVSISQDFLFVVRSSISPMKYKYPKILLSQSFLFYAQICFYVIDENI